MRRLLWLLAIVGIFTLAACGGDDNNENTSNDATTTDTTTQDDSSASTNNSADAGFSATVSGATDATVSGAGYFQCDDVGDGELTIGAGFSMTDNILILFPQGTEPGTYDLTSDTGLDADFTATYVGEDIMTAMYEDNVTGTLTLDEIAGATGEPVRGSFEFEASKDDGATVNVSGSFDFSAGENAYFNCTENG